MPHNGGRLGYDRRAVGLSLLCLATLIGTVLVAATLDPPLGRSDAVLLAGLIAASLGASAGLVWTWRSRAMSDGPHGRRELLDAAERAAVMIVDDKGVIRHWSRGCEELYGWPAARALGRRRRDLLHSQAPEPAEEVWRQLKLVHRMTNEIVERHRDGRELTVQNHMKLVDHGDGRHSVVVAVSDVTERRRVEEALRLSEARLATSVAVQGIFIYEYDLVERKPVWTTSGQTFFGVDPARPRPDSSDRTSPARYWSEELEEQVRGIIASIEANAQDRTHFDFAFRYPDGSERRVEGWARLIRGADGTPRRLLGTNLDVTERREREQELRAGEAERRAILATVPDAMFVCDRLGRLRACSAAACRLLGYGEDELLGIRLSDLVDDREARAALRRDFAISRHPEPDGKWPMPVDIRCADGERIPISFVIGDALVEGARMYVVIGRDMRPTIATEERFHRLSNDLAQVSRLGMMGEMAAALAHELSQPLSAVVNFLGAVDLMLANGRPADNERLRDALRRASDQASRAGEIIRRLRAFILRGEADMRAERLTSLVREAAALALFNSSSFGIRLAYDFESESRLVLGDRIQIQQVLVNLIRNAADAMTMLPGGRRDLLISTRMARDNLIEIAVKDSGPGIAPEMLERLFSPFATTKREGLGFGLAISRRIVEAHGGQLSAVSTPEGGAVFRFTLPVMEEEVVR